jgi:hypothetical protein
MPHKYSQDEADLSTPALTDFSTHGLDEIDTALRHYDSVEL